MKKRTFYSEAAYLLGILTIALGVAFMEKADFGVSMVVAPAYLLYLKLSETWSFITFGMMEYVFQAALLLLMILLLRKFRLSYLFSFLTAVLYGFVLDGCMALTGLLPGDTLPLRLLFYAAGMLLCSAGVALMFHTYVSPEVYELFVKELASARQWDVSRVKTFYDCTSCLLGVALSFAFFGLWHFEGVKLGTIFCALVNGWIIGKIGLLLDRRYEFKDALPFRGFFLGK